MKKLTLKQKYEQEVKGKLMKEFNLKNVNEIPKITKVVINSGVGESKNNSELLDDMLADINEIAGQKAVITKTKQAISNFKIRENMPIGVMVTLRKERMWMFLDKLINIVLPRVKDFRGINPKAFDGRGNYALGVRDHLVFPEIDTSKVVKSKHMQIIINTDAGDNIKAHKLLEFLGFPFKK